MEPETVTVPLHTYTPLQGPKHIRILILEPSLDPALPLHFTFKQASLADCGGQYEAISYTGIDFFQPNVDYTGSRL